MVQYAKATRRSGELVWIGEVILCGIDFDALDVSLQ